MAHDLLSDKPDIERVHCCDGCAVIVVNDDWSGLDIIDDPLAVEELGNSIIASLEALGNVEIAPYSGPEGYFRCWICGDDAIA